MVWFRILTGRRMKAGEWLIRGFSQDMGNTLGSRHGSAFWIGVLTEGKRDDSSAFILLPILLSFQDFRKSRSSGGGVGVKMRHALGSAASMGVVGCDCESMRCRLGVSGNRGCVLALFHPRWVSLARHDL